MITWGKQHIEQHQLYFYRTGTLEVLLKKQDNEWCFAKKRHPSNVSESSHGLYKEKLGTDLEWTSIIGEKNMNIDCKPALPELPVVLMPTSPFKVLSKTEVLIFIQVPYYIQFYSNVNKMQQLMYEASNIAYSATWFGDPDKGMLGYSLPVDISNSLVKPTHANSTIICPIRLVNVSKSILDIQRLLLHVNFLNVYQSNHQLWSNEVRIEFKGENEVSDVSYGKGKPSFLKNSTQLAEAREVKPNFFTKSFYFIKSLNNY